MIFRFTLSHGVLGSLVISEPDGWKDCTLKLERHEEFHSLIEYFEGDFVFYGDNGSENGGIDFIREVERTYGADAELAITIEIAPDNFTYQTVFIGQLDLWNIEEMPDNKAQVPIIRNDFWAKFINRFDTPVDIQSTESIDGTPVTPMTNVNLNLTNQKIRVRSEGYLSAGYVFGKESSTDLGNGEYLQVDVDQMVLDELQTKSGPPLAYNPVVPFWIYDFEYAGDYTFDIKIEFSLLIDISSPPTINYGQNSTHNYAGSIIFIECYIQKNDEAPIQMGVIENDQGDKSSTYFYNGTFTVNANDVVRIYGAVVSNWPGGSDGIGRAFLLWGRDNSEVLTDDILSASGPFNFGTPPSGLEDPTYFNVTGNTVFPESNSESFLIHDVAGAIIDRIVL